jgi:hypothetical protein
MRTCFCFRNEVYVLNNTGGEQIKLVEAKLKLPGITKMNEYTPSGGGQKYYLQTTIFSSYMIHVFTYENIGKS